MRLSQYSGDIFSHIANRGEFTKAVRFRLRLLSFLDYRLFRNTKYFSLQKLFACNNNSAESSDRNLQQRSVSFVCTVIFVVWCWRIERRLSSLADHAVRKVKII